MRLASRELLSYLDGKVIEWQTDGQATVYDDNAVDAAANGAANAADNVLDTGGNAGDASDAGDAGDVGDTGDAGAMMRRTVS